MFFTLQHIPLEVATVNQRSLIHTFGLAEILALDFFHVRLLKKVFLTPVKLVGRDVNCWQTEANHLVLTWIQMTSELPSAPPLFLYKLGKPSELPPVMHLNEYLECYNGARAN